MLSSSIVAYGFARLRFPGRNVLFLILLSTMMLPGQVTLMPHYWLFAKLQWVNSLRPLIIPVFFGSAFNIFLLRQFIMTIPTEMDDAAKIDGCGLVSHLLAHHPAPDEAGPGGRRHLPVHLRLERLLRPADLPQQLRRYFTVALGLRTLQSRLHYVPYSRSWP